MKFCNQCKIKKECSEFYSGPRNKDGLRPICKECTLANCKVYYSETRKERRAYHKRYYTGNRKAMIAKRKVYYTENREEQVAYNKGYQEKNRKEIRARRQASTYGLIPGDLGRMIATQDGACAICGGPGGKKGLCVDHDHESGKIRALLCLKCNSAIGFLNDSSALAQLAANYLKLHGK